MGSQRHPTTGNPRRENYTSTQGSSVIEFSGDTKKYNMPHDFGTRKQFIKIGCW